MATPTIGVCGFGRCGSTMVMAMLDAGGCPPVAGSQPGSYELVDILDAYSLSPDQLAGRAVKLLDHQADLGFPAARSWRFVWIDRDSTEQARSVVKFLQSIGMPTPDGLEQRLAHSYRTDRPGALGQLRRRGPVTVLRYERVLADPRKAAKRLRHVWAGLDVLAAASAVHDRDSRCLPDLDFEDGVS